MDALRTFPVCPSPDNRGLGQYQTHIDGIGAPRFELGNSKRPTTVQTANHPLTPGMVEWTDGEIPERKTWRRLPDGREMDAKGNKRWPTSTGGTESARRKRPGKAEPIGLVYAIHPQWLGPRSLPAPLKLGYTGNLVSLRRRLSALQTSHWLELRIVWTSPGFKSTEREIHERCDRYRIRGEWFRHDDDVWEVLHDIEARMAA